ncbi:YqaJ viral recombinase family protein, partial [Bacillus cereus]
MEANVLITTEDMAHEQWLEARKAGIGGSDAAAIAGLNKWSSPIAVYYDKTSETVKDQLPSEAAYFGNVLEEIVAEEFSKRTNLQVRT